VEDKQGVKKDSTNWISIVQEKHKQAEDWSNLRQIMVNVNYYVGNQWIGWNRGERRIQELPPEDNMERITLNKIRPRIMTLLAKHTKNRIKYDVIAASKEQRDIDAAKAAHKYLQYLWEQLNMPIITSNIFLNNLVKGWCALKVWFDPTAGQDITPNESEEGFEEGKQIFTGEIRTRVCDPMTIFVDPSATTPEEIRWVLERKARDVEEIFEEYGVRVSPDTNMEMLNAYDITQINASGISYTEKSQKTTAVVSELWIRPSKKYPNGVKVTIAGDQVLDLNEKAGELPYRIFGYIPIPGAVKYDALVKDMIPVQRGINIKRSMIATHAKRLGNALWLLPMGSGVDEEELTNDTGGFVYYNPANGMKPERATAPDIPSFYDRDLAQDALDLDDMSGAREVSQGRMPAGLDTLGGLEIMVEQENEKLTVAAQNYEEGMKWAMKRMLKLMKAHYTEERQARILGENNEIEIISFNGSDLTGNEDILIVQGSSLPEMRAAQQERIMLMWQNGAIVKKDGTPDVNTFLRMMGMGDSTELFEQYELDENKAKLENRMFEKLAEDPQTLQMLEQYFIEYDAVTEEVVAQGLPPEETKSFMPPLPKGLPIVRDFYDHEVHLIQHNNFRKTTTYEELPEPIQRFIDMHVAEHEQVLMAPQMQEQQMMQAQQQEQLASQQAGQEKELALKQRKLDIDETNALAKAAMAMKGGK
jgi:hypothetical protein